jgi:hypothetical protein
MSTVRRVKLAEDVLLVCLRLKCKCFYASRIPWPTARRSHKLTKWLLIAADPGSTQDLKVRGREAVRPQGTMSRKTQLQVKPFSQVWQKLCNQRNTETSRSYRRGNME